MNIILSILIAWIVSQIIKIIVSKDVNAFWKLGGMPSSHSALVGALAMGVGIQTGFASAPAAIAYVVALIVVHDAQHVRKHHNVKEIVVGLLVGIITVALLNYV